MSVINLKSAIFYELLFISYRVRVDKKAKLLKSESTLLLMGTYLIIKVYLKALQSGLKIILIYI